ncbi:vesicle-associated membrane protein 4 [Lingula anatina]|uniref:Vesicle-associated membrane protein 4 n=1 Tax=Lingula anatina TaxID=7574 RepID=A0A1S3KDM8_LINAN|nr:vesicle-associated membrane protein 4 [Lingula anatina]|eukprot:XP_013420361.1 vesicle-associated membrane protein 4 [Lingula anatina]
MPPKFKRTVDSSDMARAKDSEKVSLLGENSDDEQEDFFLKGPNARPGRLLKDEKVQRVQEQVDDVVGVMKSNIGKVLDRGERLEDLQDKSDHLNSNSRLFQARARDVRSAMWWQNCKMKIIVMIVILIIFAVIIIPIILKATQHQH